jgi:hypothetical protein
MKSNTGNHPLSCEQILSVNMKSFTHCVVWVPMVVCPPGSKQYCDPYRFPGGVRFLYTDCRISLDIPTVLGMTFTLRIQLSPVVASIKVYYIIHRLDWPWSWQQNLVHSRLFFICFPCVKTLASRLLFVLLSAQFDRLEYP